MSILEDVLGFVHKESQRTGYVTDGPFCHFDKSGVRDNDGRWPVLDVTYAVKWDDTGKDGDVLVSQIDWIPKHKRHITDGERTCHCRAATIEGIVIHRSSEEQN